MFLNHKSTKTNSEKNLHEERTRTSGCLKDFVRISKYTTLKSKVRIFHTVIQLKLNFSDRISAQPTRKINQMNEI